eukprot:4713675-Lingulodinium_polyedra.AAC.1
MAGGARCLQARTRGDPAPGKAKCSAKRLPATRTRRQAKRQRPSWGAGAEAATATRANSRS